jgi:hypothetical protein
MPSLDRSCIFVSLWLDCSLGIVYHIYTQKSLTNLGCTLHENGDWDDYHRFRRQHRHARLYKTPFPGHPASEFACLELTT